MIYVTGDTHSDFRRFDVMCFPEQRYMTKDDYVIICGDFGGVWFDEGNKNYSEQEKRLDALENKPFTTLFVDGNHENFDILNSLEVHDWNGGKIHKVRDTVFHLMRGEMFDINGTRIFALGGAESHDIQDGILEFENWHKEAKKLWIQGKDMYRVKHLSWWEQELPSKEELKHADETLEKYNYECDFFITHCCAVSTGALIGVPENNEFTQYLEKLKYEIKYKKHFFGHHHDNRNLPDNEILIYEQIIRVA